MPVLITSAIRVSSARTALGDEQARLRETLNGLKQWVTTPVLRQIVVCDGSGFDLNPFLSDLREAHRQVEIEVLTFNNDANAVRARGKGYGEGEIVNYALANSRFLAASPAFAKCTGKLWVSNFEACVLGFNGSMAFDYNGWFSVRFIDTRFYITKKAFYQEMLASAHRNVDDGSGYYLEHSYRDALSGLHISQYAMCPTPRIHGVSGSMGAGYQVNKSKARLRDVRSKLVRFAGL